MIVHLALFSFPAPLSETAERELRDHVKLLADNIKDIDQMRFGTPLSTELTRGYGYLLLLELKDEQALHAYLDHPAHRNFVQWLTEHACTPLIFDLANASQPGA